MSDGYEMGRVVKQLTVATFTTPAGPITDPTVHAVPAGSMTAACGVVTHQRIGVAWRLRGSGSAPVCPDCLTKVG